MRDTMRDSNLSRNTSEYTKVTLICQAGMIYTLWLPSTMEGRYTFRDEINSAIELPLYIEAEDKKWVVYLGKEAMFLPKNLQESPKMVLSNGMIIKIFYKRQEYALFTEIGQQDDWTFLPYYLEERMDYTIGRHHKSDICYKNEFVSSEHAVLSWRENGWTILDCTSKNGTYVNGCKVKSARLKNGDVIFIMGLYILIGSGFISMNNANDRVEITTSKIRRITGRDNMAYSHCPEKLLEEQLFDRYPRKRIQISAENIKIEMPPMSITASKIPMLLQMGSPMLMGGRALMTGNIITMLTSLVFPALTQGFTEKDRKEYEAKRIALYREYLEEKEAEIVHEKYREEKLLNELYPDMETTLQFVKNRTRLWERRKVDEDFLNIRIGTGKIPMIAKVEYREKQLEMEQDELVGEMYALAEKPIFLENTPVMLPLRNSWVVGVLGERRYSIHFVQNIIMQFALTHSYDEIKLVLLVDKEDAVQFSFVRYLPHIWNNDRSIRFFVTTRSGALKIGEYLSKEFAEVLGESSKKNFLRKNPAYIVLALSKNLFDCVEVFKELLVQEEYCGLSIVAAFDNIPKECRKLIDFRNSKTMLSEKMEGRIIDLVESEVRDQDFFLDSYDNKMSQFSMRSIMQTKLMINSQTYSLPNMITFFEMFGVGKVEHLNPILRWETNDPVKSLATPIGIGTDGRIFTLDLHEKHQGPHGLVAGMTGSGKSEFLITYILSMAVNFSPDEVAFILIDYKGGGLADAFEDKERGVRLPHLVGTITNLDGTSIQRSLMSIKSELTRRQTVFKKVKSQTNEGTLDIYDYQRLYRNHKVNEPMPHLFIISDEFAELKQQQSEFMNELISAARIGRSLGVHLILATQKPGGVVDNQIWSNTKFRACLRVQDRGDSMEMLKRPEAAELKQTGRFYLQVGYNEYFALGQSAWCGADYVPQEEVLPDQDNSIQFLDDVGQVVLDIKPEMEKKPSDCRQIVAVVKYLSDLAKRENIFSQNLWTEPLPKQIELSDLINMNNISKDKGINALIGMVDDPEHQRQFPLSIDLMSFHNMLLVGDTGSGKSTFVRTMLYSLVNYYSPEDLNYYILDLSNEALVGYSQMPHCGAYLTEKNEEDISRLMIFIHNIVEQRKKCFAEAEVTNFEVYRRVKRIPLILFIVDNFINIKNFKEGDALFIQFQGFLREGANFGIRYVLTCNHINEINSWSKQEIDYRISLQAKDYYEYSDILAVRCKYSPPELCGRGMCVVEGHPLEYHVAVLDCMKPEEERGNILKERLREIKRHFDGNKIAERLSIVNIEESYEEFCKKFPKERIPLGYTRGSMKPVALPFQQMHSMTFYFGNSKCIYPVFRNLVTAAAINDMELYIFRRLEGSIFDEISEKNPIHGFLGKYTLFDSTIEGLVSLSDIIIDKIAERNILRDEYSIQQGIPLTAKGRSKKAAKYIRKHSTPLLVLFESFADICKVEMVKTLEQNYITFFNQMFGYNIYFAAGLYPDDDKNISTNILIKKYNKEGLLLLFGGQYDKIILPGIPYDITSLSKLNSQYNFFLMKYREVFYWLTMPCGSLEETVEDLDEAAII